MRGFGLNRKKHISNAHQSRLAGIAYDKFGHTLPKFANYSKKEST